MTERVDLARQISFVAAELERRGYPLAGVVHQAAHALLEQATEPTGTEARCRGCGDVLAAQGRGRPRVWCAERCRNRHRRK